MAAFSSIESPALVVRMIQGIREVRLDSLRVLHPAPVQHLVQHLDHVGVRFLDLVEQDNTVRCGVGCLRSARRHRRIPTYPAGAPLRPETV